MCCLVIAVYVEYLLVEWNEEDGHSVVEGKFAELTAKSDAFAIGANVICHLKDGDYGATILHSGTCILVMTYIRLGTI